MILDLVFIAGGLVLLVAAGDALVQGAVALSLKLGVSALIVSLTVVAFGTSAPELLVSIKATLDGATGLVFGNVVGSNIANVFLVLGVPALIAPIHVAQPGLKRNFVMMIAASVLFIAVCGYGGLYFWIGVAFLCLLAAILFDAYIMAEQGVAPVELEDADEQASGLKVGLLIVAGLIGLPLGAHFLVEGARSIALEFGVSEAAIGLTLVAIGTSLPELATTVMAAIRRQADVAVGNVVGSNLFNILAVAGGAALFGDLPTPAGFLELDLWIMLGAALAIAPFVALRRDIGRWSGVFFLAAYVCYIVIALGPRM
ncbi:MAG: calcium/sodium antiporter [Pseudomonadota bacterium]